MMTGVPASHMYICSI